MLRPDKNNNDPFESRMAADERKARRSSIGVVVILLLLGLFVVGWFALDEWLESGKLLPAAIEGSALVVALAVTTAATTVGSSRQCSGDCWLKKLYHRVKHRLTSPHETPWHQP